eukprot:sb/3469827/
MSLNRGPKSVVFVVVFLLATHAFFIGTIPLINNVHVYFLDAHSGICAIIPLPGLDKNTYLIRIKYEVVIARIIEINTYYILTRVSYSLTHHRNLASAEADIGKDLNNERYLPPIMGQTSIYSSGEGFCTRLVPPSLSISLYLSIPLPLSLSLISLSPSLSLSPTYPILMFIPTCRRLNHMLPLTMEKESELTHTRIYLSEHWPDPFSENCGQSIGLTGI